MDNNKATTRNTTEQGISAEVAALGQCSSVNVRTRNVARTFQSVGSVLVWTFTITTNFQNLDQERRIVVVATTTTVVKVCSSTVAR